ncbi:restriction endonuclease [Jidongwangia harbinensis]|uniref:restriction endonuclease n=1 Tax=Jidongwangia harbinensis TaxID=2878561 RepID=UPI001CD9DADA|nr:restriction endonuclease [Jidongwangia harbinensis]
MPCGTTGGRPSRTHPKHRRRLRRPPVDVSAVRDLFGTLQNEGASKGILVTTSGYGPPHTNSRPANRSNSSTAQTCSIYSPSTPSSKTASTLPHSSYRAGQGSAEASLRCHVPCQPRQE